MGKIRPRSRSLLLLLLSCWSCQSVEPPLGGDAGVIGSSCIDNDGDSYGVFCASGLDCDDEDATVWDTCAGPDRCATPNDGCPCEHEGEEITCRTDHPQLLEDGSTLCFAGLRTCEGGEWGECTGLTAYDPPGAGDEGLPGGGGAYRQAVLDGPPPAPNCSDSCETACRDVYDCPSSLDFTVANSLNLRYDLPYVGPPPLPAALIIDPTKMQGMWGRVIDSNCPAGTQPQWWSINYKVELSSVNSTLTIYAKTADTAAGANPLAALGPNYAKVATCSGAGTCPPPLAAYSRQDPDNGNIENPAVEVGNVNTKRRFLGLRFQWDHTPVSTPARLEHYTVYYFCDDAT